MDRSPSKSADPASTAQTTAQAYLLAALALLASLLLVILYWRNAQQREVHNAQAEFVADATETSEALLQRLASYRLISRGAVALFASVEQPSAVQWRDYVSGLKVGQQFPSLLGLGFAAYLSRSQLQEFQLAERDAGHGFFIIRPTGIREFYGPITYLEPRTPENIFALGYDMYAEPVRHAAMIAARDSGDARLTGNAHLVQDGPIPGTGLLLYSPVYRGGGVPASVAARRDALEGWVYAPFRINRFVAVTLGAKQRYMGIRIVDVTDKEEVLYSSLQPSARDDMFEHSIPMDAFGRRWRLDFQSDKREALAGRTSELNVTLTIGVLASLLLFGIAMTLARTESQAQAIAARMSESYRRSELRFRSAMEYSAIGKGLLDRAGNIVDINPALVALFGSTRERLLGTAFGAHFVDGVGKTMRTSEMEALVEGVYKTIRQLKRPTGEQRDVQLTFAPVPGNVGQDIARLVQVEDITERVRSELRIHALNRSLEARVAQRTRELTQVNQELESFAYSVSHDLRAPLRAIDGFSRLLTERYASAIDDAGRDYLMRICNAAGRMGELIESLLKMSRLSRTELKVAPLDLSRMAREIIDELGMAHPQRSVDVVIEPGLRAAGDATLMRDLLQNLLGNAWKFTSEKAHARIEFGAEPAGEEGEGKPADGKQANEKQAERKLGFFVRDNGAGFAPEYADKLFRPFQRLHSQDRFPGDGIGLASVKRIVERHGGSIRGEGRADEGATFHFTLPIVDEEQGETGSR